MIDWLNRVLRDFWQYFSHITLVQSENMNILSHWLKEWKINMIIFLKKIEGTFFVRIRIPFTKWWFVPSLPVVKICPMVLEKTFENCQCVKVFAIFAFISPYPFLKRKLRVPCVKFGLDLKWSLNSRSFWLRAAYERCKWKITEALFQWRTSMHKNGRGLPNDLMEYTPFLSQGKWKKAC